MTETEHNGVVAVQAAETSKDARQLLADITADVTGQEWVNAVEGLVAKMNQRIAGLEAELAAALDVDWVSRPTYEAAMQRIAELEAERQWQTIDTVPKDGTVILGKGGIYHGVPFPVKWAPSQYSPDRSWEDVINRTNFDDHCIIHWMPLPASPHEGASQ